MDIKEVSGFSSIKDAALNAAAGGLPLIKGATQVVSAISTVHGWYAEGDDARLLAKLTDGKCGGIDQASPNVARCFKKYLIGTLYRFSIKSPYTTTRDYYAQFNKCLGSWNDNDCEDGWFFRTDVFK